jgi:hypothetical protein
MALPRLDRAVRSVSAPVDLTFDVLTDLKRHAGAFPFTTMAAPPAPPRVGDRFEAVTLGFLRDIMVLERLATSADGGHRAVYRKVGGMFRGTVEMTARPSGTDRERSEVSWVYDVWLPTGPRWLSRRAVTIGCTLAASIALYRLGGLAEDEARSA